ncbi:hypothetical protein BX666DRAFT_1535702 [Dichotomocladium elegans]|nr:hypothetical protein BX666DRAFT_1535702 [Dichotomocladium elegans]
MEKLLNAQKDGAIAAIVYDNVPFDQDPIASTGMFIQPDVVSIPAYYVDLAVGTDLQTRLANVSDTSLIRVTLFPPQHARLDPWQFALIVIGLVVLTSIAILVQCHLWRTDQNSHGLLTHRVGITSRSGDDDDDDNDDDEAAAQELYWRLTVSAAALPAHAQLSADAVAALPVRISVDGEKDQTCVICLESYTKGDNIKTLPCRHEYHKDCIDPWLLKKSESCPLCLQAVRPPPTLPPAIHAPPEDPNDIEMTARPLSSEPSQPFSPRMR